MGEQGLVGDGDGGGDGEQGLVGDGEQGVWAAGAGDYCHMSPPPLQPHCSACTNFAKNSMSLFNQPPPISVFQN